jgi:hypothetical protein
MNNARRSMVAAFGLAVAALGASAQEKLHFTYLWHLEQPIYWPDQQTSGQDRYERAWESIQRKNAGGIHPTNNLTDIFGLDDRRAAYQYRIKDSIDAFDWAPEAGAQISYSGGLIENITSLGNANQLGYTPTWYSGNRTARAWQTSGTNAKPRLDIVVFPFHHALMPLLDESTMRKQVQLYKEVYADAWGTSPGVSKGFFPSEMAFSTRMIPVLASEGIEWSIVSAEKLSRACTDFPVVFGSGGINCDPPNKADQVNPAQTNYYRQSISRGCAPAEAVPFALTPHRAQYVNPDTGVASSIIVVPSSQSMSWKDGYAPIGLSDFNNIQPFNNPSRPMLVVLAHDGDNAWGGGYSYYMEATPNLVSTASAAGYVPTVIQKYLTDHPVPAGDVVHVEDGGWVNADGDFGSPQFINWNWPPVNAAGSFDIPGGWAEDERNWAVLTAAQNRVETAAAIVGAVDPAKVVDPLSGANSAERAWHYLLAGYESGYMYYGASLDMEIKATLACNQAVQLADPIVAGGADTVAPTVWLPQRLPWNPGSNGDFWVWTFAYDASGITGATLKYRIDADGANATGTTHNETYAGGTDVGAWQSIAMTERDFPAGNVYNDPNLNFFEMPQYIADQYHAKIVGIRSKLVDYYIEAVDTRGNVTRSPIQHVWVGDGSGGGGGGPTVAISPNPAIAGQNVTITYDPTGRPLAGAPVVKVHYGFNNWSTVIAPDPSMTLASGTWTITVPVSPSATQLDIVFNNGASTWDNNGGADWHFPVTGGGPADEWEIDGIRDTDSVLIATNGGVSLWAGLKGNDLYVATNDAGEGNDHFIFVARDIDPLVAAPWAKAGQVAGWNAFLADENSNDYEGWFDAAGATQAATGPNGGVLEGTINLVGELGSLPEAIRLAVGAYTNSDGGTLVPGAQVPGSLDTDGNLESNEWIVVDLCTLTPEGCCPADVNGDTELDVLDFLDFIDSFGACENQPAPCAGSSGVSADYNGDTLVDVLDFLDFLDAFGIGCD